MKHDESHSGQDRPFEVYAIKYADHERDARDNFITPPLGCSGPMPMDYYVWLLRKDEEAIVVDTGFSAQMAVQRGRRYLQCPSVTLACLDVDVRDVQRVVLTHLHYDHAGNIALFPNATFIVQRQELEYAGGRYMAHRFLALAYERDDIERIAAERLAGRVRLVDHDVEIASGLSVHWVGGHTAGLQVVRVWTTSGWVVLASDLFHFYANREHAAPFPIVLNVGDMLDAFVHVGELASEESLVIPGHDPLVMARFPSDARAKGLAVRIA